VAALACSHGSTRLPVGRDVVEPMSSNALPADVVLWTAARRLSWSDFLGVPQMGADATAVTSVVLRYTAECDSNAFSYRVEAAFVPRQSWVKPAVLMLGPASRRTLQHEQTHFDLAEVDARRIRQALSRLTNPCGMTSEQRNAIAARLIEENGEVQQRYDRETAHGLDRERQTEWETTVSRQLASLGRYAR
jgi:uncharacterized protein DUF922